MVIVSLSTIEFGNTVNFDENKNGNIEERKDK